MIILLVEDEALVALTLEMTLSEAGYTVLGPVATVRRALNLAEQTVPDLALVNIHLRDGGSGIELAGELRSRWTVPVLFVSGQRADAHAHRDLALGYLGKPYDANAVLASITFIRQAQGQEALQRRLGEPHRLGRADRTQERRDAAPRLQAGPSGRSGHGCHRRDRDPCGRSIYSVG